MSTDDILKLANGHSAAVASATPTPPKLAKSLPIRPFDLSARAQAVLLALLAGDSVDQAAALVGWPRERVLMLQKVPAARSLLERIRKSELGRLTAGDLGPAAIAKAASESMMNILIGQAKSARSDAVRRQAAMDVLALAGHVAIKKAEILNVNELIDALDPSELDLFIREGRWPDRLRDKTNMLTMRIAKEIKASEPSNE